MTYDQVKAELQKRLGVLQARLAGLKQIATRSHSGDSAEQAQERENDEVVDAIGNETRQSIREIQAALERIDAGTYGTCESCGDEISQGRLQVIPEARHCVRCADAPAPAR